MEMEILIFSIVIFVVVMLAGTMLKIYTLGRLKDIEGFGQITEIDKEQGEMIAEL